MSRARPLSLALLAAILVACGNGEEAGTEVEDVTTTTEEMTTTTEEMTTTTEEMTTTTEEETTTTAAEEMGDALQTAESDHGTIVVDSEGFSLYVFLPDEGGEPSCVEQCAVNWPPLTGDLSAGEGIDESLIGTAEHPESGEMVTYGGWPLYYFANDSAPGDTNGQGVNEVWYLIGPDGEVIQG